MLKPYIVVEEADDHTTYEYNTKCTFWLYLMIGLLVIDVMTMTEWLIWVFMVLMLAYFIVILVPATRAANSFRRAMKHGKIEMTGSRWSLSNPLRITVPKSPPDDE
jgi:hypothetical protein